MIVSHEWVSVTAGYTGTHILTVEFCQRSPNAWEMQCHSHLQHTYLKKSK